MDLSTILTHLLLEINNRKEHDIRVNICTNTFDPFLGVPGLKLIEQFVTDDEERQLLEKIDLSPWNTSIKRRTQHYGYVYDYSAKGITKTAPPIPDWCGFIIDRLMCLSVISEKPNQMIINEYEPGQGIAPHTDSVDNFEDGIVSLSLGSDIIMDFNHPRKSLRKEGFLSRRSVLSMHGIARYEWRHGIASREKDHEVERYRRVSLTFRKIKVK